MRLNGFSNFQFLNHFLPPQKETEKIAKAVQEKDEC